MEIHSVHVRENLFVVFPREESTGRHYPKGSPEYDEIQQYVEDHPECIVPEIVTPVPEEILANRARSKRDQLLSSCDWTQVSDAPVDQNAWRIYRQALRDITKQAYFPTEIVWPTEPTN